MLIGPFIPDRNAVFLEIGDVRVAFQEPEQLNDDRAQMQLLRGHHREAIGKVEPHLAAEHGACARAGPVGTLMPIVQDVLQEIEILLHVGLGGESVLSVNDTTKIRRAGKAGQPS